MYDTRVLYTSSLTTSAAISAQNNFQGLILGGYIYRYTPCRYAPALSQQLFASVSGTVHEVVSSSTDPCDPLVACVCAGCQSHRSSQSACFLPCLPSYVPPRYCLCIYLHSDPQCSRHLDCWPALCLLPFSERISDLHPRFSRT